ncbi:hypothetical protein GCM10010129_39510 [Streptomyces fumigatiscleroticus]|nr:hypothetical protein GCM10010129_39510 [Streptomyces fumigatiscleroticus]
MDGRPDRHAGQDAAVVRERGRAVRVTGRGAYVGAPPELSLFGGHWYQIPLTQLILCPVVFVVPTVVLVMRPRMTGQEVAVFAGTPPSGGIRHGAVRLLAGIGFARGSRGWTQWGTGSLFMTSARRSPSFLRGEASGSTRPGTGAGCGSVVDGRRHRRLTT